MKSFNLSEWALAHQQLVLYLIAALLVSGVFAYINLGQAEDPEFTIKVIVIDGTAFPPHHVDRCGSHTGDDSADTQRFLGADGGGDHGWIVVCDGADADFFACAVFGVV